MISLMNFLFPHRASAHIAYVLDEKTRIADKGEHWDYLLSALHNPKNIVLIISTIIGIIVLYFIVKSSKKLERYFDTIKEKLASYHEFIPWITRLALGIALIGAGSSNVLISPTFQHAHEFAFIQIFIGFCFLMGFLLIPSTLIAIGLYGIALYHNPYMIGNLDFLGLALGLLVFHSARPGIDDLLQISLLSKIKINREWFAFIARTCLGIAMIFLALYEKILNPLWSDAVVKQFNLTHVIPVEPSMWVLSVGIIELVIGIVLLLGWFTRTTSIVAIIVLSCTFFFFKEAVYSHVTLFSILAATTIEGGGKLSIDRWLEQRKNKRIA